MTMGRLEWRVPRGSLALQGTRAPWVCPDQWGCRACLDQPDLLVFLARVDLKVAWVPRERGETTAMWGGRAPRARRVTGAERDPGGGKVSEASVGRPEHQVWTLPVQLGLTGFLSLAAAGGRKSETQ